MWQKHSALTFEEIVSADDADIRLSFEEQNHEEIDPFKFNDITLAHAFQPGFKLGGDIHFFESVKWDFNTLYDEQPDDGKVSFFAVVLHEAGHSLGLGHSSDPTAVMYKYYSLNTATLSNDDIYGIHHIYGVPLKPTSGIFSSESGENTDVNSNTPDKCNTSYDAIATIRGELFIFKDEFMWRPDTTDDFNEIRQLWNELPAKKRVDAVFENFNGKILIFIGDQIFVFESTNLVDKLRLYHIGMGWHVKKIDTIFRWPYNGKVYIFTGNNYYRFDEKLFRVETNYPKLISSAFRDVYSIDTALAFKNQLYFFKNENFYEFDDNVMRLKRMLPQLSAVKFMKCITPKLFAARTNFNDENQDYIILEEENDKEIEPFHHFEKSQTSASQNFKRNTILMTFLFFYYFECII